jgi:WD40 repeat protein
VTNPDEWHEVMLLDRHAGAVNSATFSPDGKWIVTSGSDHTARVWDAATDK